MIQKDRNTRDHLAWTIVTGDPMQEACISHSIPRAWEQQGYPPHENKDENV